MKVSVELAPEHREPYAIIYTDKVTDEIQRMMDALVSVWDLECRRLFIIRSSYRCQSRF